MKSGGGHAEYSDNNPNSVERGNSDESDIRKERGLSDPDITGGHSAGGNRNEVRNDERDLLHSPDSFRRECKIFCVNLLD